MSKMTKSVLFLSIGLIVGLLSFDFGSNNNELAEAGVPDHLASKVVFDHTPFDRILTQYVDEVGLVDYQALKTSPVELDSYLESLNAFEPAQLEESEQLAFWLNVYNAYTLKLIINNYPITSIRQAANGPFIPKLNTPWEVDVVKVGGKTLNLDFVEHKIVRKNYDEPRIHFALVCAALSCPKLRREAYTGERLDEQLQEQGVDFLGTPSKNLLEDGGKVLRISKIFKWFGKDFKKDGQSLQQFLASFFKGQVAEDLKENRLKIKYTKYDWSLNDQLQKARS